MAKKEKEVAKKPAAKAAAKPAKAAAKGAKAAASKKALTKNQVIAELASKTELPKKTVILFIDELLALAYKEAKKEGGFVFPGLGKLIISKRAARTIKNPQTKEPMNVPAKNVLKFRILKAAKDSVLGAAKK